MSEQPLSGGGPSADDLICPWCSAALPAADVATCPSCGAALREPSESDIPGVTKVDHESLLKGRAPVQKSRGLMGWLSGEYAPAEAPVDHESIAPPAEEVRREMLRLEMAALEAEAQARRGEAVSLVVEAVDAEAGHDPDAIDPDAALAALAAEATEGSGSDDADAGDVEAAGDHEESTPA